jgi:AAA domain
MSTCPPRRSNLDFVSKMSRRDLERGYVDMHQQLLEAVNRNEQEPGAESQRVLTLRSPDELLAMPFDDSDIILGDRLLAKGQSLVIPGAGGTGKSRLALQMVASVVAGRKFLEFDTSGKDLRWLILQTENSNRRLKHDLSKIKSWLGKDWLRFAKQVVIHTLETDDDGFVSLEAQENQKAIEAAIKTANPYCIVIDPLNDFAAGDLNKDADMKATLQSLSRLCRRGNPQRAITVLHHSLTGKSGASRAVGFDRSSFARNSKVLHAWTRGQINLAPVEPESNDRLIVACGKCSNGKEFEPFGIVLNHDTLIYEIDDSFDLDEWQAEMSGNKKDKDSEPLMTPERVRELCRAVMAKAQLAKAIIADCGCARQVSYRYIGRAQKKGFIEWDAKAECFNPK